MRDDKYITTDDVPDIGIVVIEYIDLCSKKHSGLIKEGSEKAAKLDEKLANLNQLLLKTGTFDEVYKSVTGFINHTYASGYPDQYTLSACGKAVVAKAELEKALIESKASDLIILSQQQQEAIVAGDHEAQDLAYQTLYDTCLTYREEGSLDAVGKVLDTKLGDLQNTTDFPTPVEADKILATENAIRNVYSVIDSLPDQNQMTFEDFVQ